MTLSEPIGRVLRRQEQALASDASHVAKQALACPGGEQHGIVVEVGLRNGQPGERIPGVVFDDDEHPAWPENPGGFSCEIPPGSDRDMVQYRDGETAFKTVIRERQPDSVIEMVVNIPVSDGGLFQSRVRNVASSHVACPRPQMLVQQPDAAADVERFDRAQIVAVKESLQPFRLAPDKPVVRQAERLHLGRVVGRIALSPAIGVPHAS